jgi:hypothetical protein
MTDDLDLNDYYLARLAMAGIEYYGDSAYDYWMGRNDAGGRACGGSHIAAGKKCHVGGGSVGNPAKGRSRFHDQYTPEDEDIVFDYLHKTDPEFKNKPSRNNPQYKDLTPSQKKKFNEVKKSVIEDNKWRDEFWGEKKPETKGQKARRIALGASLIAAGPALLAAKYHLQKKEEERFKNERDKAQSSTGK